MNKKKCQRLLDTYRASGFLDFLSELLGRFTSYIGFPGELVPLAIVKMFSSSAASGLLVDVFKEYGTDSFLGLGWAATPAGLKAIEELRQLDDDRRAGRAAGPVRKKGIASNEMCTFLIINISSLQLIPVNVIACRSQYGSVNPAAIVGAGIVATAVSTETAVIFCKIMDRRRRKRKNTLSRL